MPQESNFDRLNLRNKLFTPPSVLLPLSNHHLKKLQARQKLQNKPEIPEHIIAIISFNQEYYICLRFKQQEIAPRMVAGMYACSHVSVVLVFKKKSGRQNLILSYQKANCSNIINGQICSSKSAYERFHLVFCLGKKEEFSSRRNQKEKKNTHKILVLFFKNKKNPIVITYKVT